MNKTKKYTWLMALSVAVLLTPACSDTPIPKPHAYFRIDFPEKAYESYNTACPFVFEYPVYGQIVPVTRFDEPCMFNIVFSQYRATIHLTYKPVNKNFDQLLEDDWTFVFKKIAQKADAIDPKTYYSPENHVFAMVYDIKGNAASPIQFYATDSVRHFLRGALYFNAQPNYDSLAPAINFFHKDIDHIITSLKWTKY